MQNGREMTIHFIGAGPGAADLITIRGRDLIASSPVCLYAGSLVPKDLLAHCPANARIIDTAPMALEAIVAEFVRAHSEGKDVARLHSGDLSIWSAMGEQLRELDRLPNSLYNNTRRSKFCRCCRRAETRTYLARSRAIARAHAHQRTRLLHATERNTCDIRRQRDDMAIHLSIHAIEKVVAELLPFYGPDCPAAVVCRASWPDERILQAPLAQIAEDVAAAGLSALRSFSSARRSPHRIFAQARFTMPITSGGSAHEPAFATHARHADQEI